MILVPVDFKESSQNALNFAGFLAKKAGQKLLIQHHKDEREVPLDHYEKRMAGAKEELRVIAQEINEYFHVETETVLTTGDFIKDITDKSKQCDLMVIGTNGVGNLAEYYQGTNAENLTKKAHCPVLVIPSTYTKQKVKKVAYATNYQQQDQDALRELADFVKIYKAELTIVHISDKNEIYGEEIFDSYKDFFSSFLDDFDVKYKLIYGESVEESLENYVNDNQVDVLSLLHRKDDLFKRMFSHSLSLEMVEDAFFPVLIFREEY